MCLRVIPQKVGYVAFTKRGLTIELPSFYKLLVMWFLWSYSRLGFGSFPIPPVRMWPGGVYAHGVKGV